MIARALESLPGSLTLAREVLFEPEVGLARARHHERRMLLASHPAAASLAAIARAIGPITTVPVLGHVVTDMGLAREVLGDPDRFSKMGPASVSAGLTAVFGPNALLNMDGPLHRALRARLGALFTPRFVHELIADLFAKHLADVRRRLVAGETVDLVAVSRLLMGRVVAELLAVEIPPGREDEFCLSLFELGVEIGSIISIARKPNAKRVAFARERLDRLVEHTRAAYDRSDERTVPGRLRSLGLSFEETRGVVGILFLAGLETTATAIPRIVAVLLDTGTWTRVRNDRSLVPRAIDEGLRVISTVPLMTRNVTGATSLGGKQLAKDDRVVILKRYVMHGAAYGDDPESFLLDRTYPRENTNLWFGHGTHFCLGYSLAKREIELTLEALLDAGELRIERRTYGRRVIFPAYASLEVRVSPKDSRNA